MYSIKEMAKKLGKNIQTLRNWDKSKKFIAQRTPTKRMFYTHEQYLEATGNKKQSPSDDFLTSKTILITGSGTLATCAVDMLKDTSKKIIIYSRDEHKHRKLRERFFNSTNIRYIIGDVKDKNKLVSSLRNVDVCLHTAALKMIESGFYSADEVIKVNTVGTMNVAEACIECDVGRALFISSDKACLDYYATVTLADGTRRKIGEIVENKEKVDVLTYDANTGHIVVGKVINWFKNERAGRALYEVACKNTRRYGEYRIRTIVTEDHKFLTKNRSWVQAKDLNEDDLLITDETLPNIEQQKLLCGLLLGDASIFKSKIINRSKNPRGMFKYGQTEKSFEWFGLVYNALKNLGIKKFRKYIGKTRPNPFYSFNMTTSSYMLQIYNQFYKDGKKIVPRELIESFFSPTLLSAWINDDGCRSRSNLRLATHSFCKEDVEWLVKLFKKHGFVCWAYGCKYKDKIYYELRFDVESTRKINSLICKLTPNCFQHKLLDGYRGSFDSNLWDIGKQPGEQYVDTPIVKKSKRYAKNVYCIEVENTNNFISSGMIVHNCNPLNGLTYGLSKALAESAWLSYNNHSTRDGTILFATRYGNVINSANSFYDILEGQKKQGKIKITDPNMTRFYFTIEEAMRLNIYAINHSVGGEIFIPKLKSSDVMTFINTFADGFPIEITGVRGTEKLAEEMISEIEMGYTYACKDENGKEYLKIIPPYITQQGLGWDGYRPLEKPIKPFKYTSSSKDVERLTPEELKNMVKK